MDWDIFISHAWEDKEAFARPLARALEARGLRVWFDEFTLTIGDSLRRSIDRGLANSRYGVVVLSPYFFEKEWSQKELDGLVSRESDGEKVILPIWHDITRVQVERYSPLLAGRLAALSSRGVDQVVEELLRAIDRDSRSTTAPPRARSSPAALTITTPIHLELVRVPAGEFLMGSDSKEDKDAYADEQPQHRLYLPDFTSANTL